MSKFFFGLAASIFGLPKTGRYDALIKEAGISINPHLFLSASRAFTSILLISSIFLLILYYALFSFSNPILFLPSLYLLACFFLEFFELFEFSPLVILAGAYVSWRRMQVENELPYAMLFLNQLLSLGIPLETALRELRRQEHLGALVAEIEHPKIMSRPITEFMGFIEQCRRVGVTPQILEDLVVMSNTQREFSLSRFRSMGTMAGHIFTYVLALYTSSILFIIVTSINAGSSGLEFILLDIVNPLLFVAGFLYLVRGWSA